ncbi:hypothetical protein GCM10027406_28820 [Leifsonia lichenia]
MAAKPTAARHLTLVGGTGGGKPRPGLRRLRAAVLQEYLDKLPEFLFVSDLLQMCGMRYPELMDAVEGGRLTLVKREGGMGIVVADNLVFLRERRLLQLPVPNRVRVSPERDEELIGVSGEAYAELLRRADDDGVGIADVIDGLLAR